MVLNWTPLCDEKKSISHCMMSAVPKRFKEILVEKSKARSSIVTESMVVVDTANSL